MNCNDCKNDMHELLDESGVITSLITGSLKIILKIANPVL